MGGSSDAPCFLTGMSYSEGPATGFERYQLIKIGPQNPFIKGKLAQVGSADRRLSKTRLL